ncbi:MAG: hypothetical protein KA052_01110 [Candidatus Pacebacteria bacterium]|nr:hypothetical protein [Candidatus Paceibacterota bacterium]
MQKVPHTLLSIFDASPEQAHFESPIVTKKARALGKAIGHAGLGVIFRLGPAVVGHILAALEPMSVTKIVLSPASNRHEHEKAYRLPLLSIPVVYSGRGALPTDTMALNSSGGVIIFGSHKGTLENILECIKESRLPIGVLTDEDTPSIHERVRTVAPHLTAELHVSHDPDVLVKELSHELRRLMLEEKLAQ